MNHLLDPIQKEIVAGMALTKCQQCGCMREALDHLATQLPTISTPETQAFVTQVTEWSTQMHPVKYACLGCEYCYGAVAQNAFATAFPSLDHLPVACDFQPHASAWPSVVGEYFVIDATAHVAVSTLSNSSLAEALAHRQPKGLAIVGKTETENIGIDKVIKNIVTNCEIQFLIVAGQDSVGHSSGQTLVALSKNGMDEHGRVIGSSGKRPILRNVTTRDVADFRAQVQVIDLIGCEDVVEIMAQIEKLSPKQAVPCG